jgi:hypothetical protein
MPRSARNEHLQVLLSSDERALLRQLADDVGESVSCTVRRLVRAAHSARFGDELRPLAAPRLDDVSTSPELARVVRRAR